MSGVDLGEAAGGRIKEPSGLRQPLLIPVGAPAGDGPVSPQSAGVERTGRDLDERNAGTLGWAGHCRGFGLLRGFLGWG